MKKILLFSVVMLFAAISTFAQRNSILFITNETMQDQLKAVDHLDQPMIDILKESYDVDIAYTPFTEIDFSKYAMVFIGRAVTSNDFKELELWAKVDIPIFFVNAWIMRSSHLKFFNTTSVKKVAAINYSGDGTSYVGTITSAEVVDPEDPAFAGIDIANGKIEWYNSFYDYIELDRATIEAECPAKLLAFTADDPLTVEGNGRIAFARFSPDVETYTGSGHTPASYRTYLHMGADDNVANPNKNFNYWNQTPTSEKVILNEVAYLISLSKNKVSAASIFKTDYNIHVYTASGNIVVDMLQTNGSQKANINIINLAGQTVYNRGAITGNKLIINDAQLSSGIYFVSVNAGKQHSVSKIVVK